ncbi:hypothetical protein F0344_15695 [Streptomyces finlayi]|uniref:Uncharacterized protein n=1 Tax=Streptomyces finlayi TaxID=67296 RepID=A0A7G7BKM0_9ACTN|nr:DUF6232 family protein [Streptomyces finlayi]QNE75885.1 hypothetical protein F0344_15695 [Streptomyces finlayi]
MPVPLDLVVTKRLLWVAGAAYPLQNVARVYTFVLHPRRGEAVARFFKRSTLAVLVAMAFTVFGGMAGYLARGEEGFEGIITFVWVATVAALVFFLADMLVVATASSHFVMAVESNGRSTALVTGDPAHLNQLVQQIAHAIENPETELSVRVEKLTISNPSNYYFGDAVNMYGGQGNVGMSGL